MWHERLQRSTGTSPLILVLVSQSTNWNPGGLLGSEAAQFPDAVYESAEVWVPDRND